MYPLPPPHIVPALPLAADCQPELSELPEAASAVLPSLVVRVFIHPDAPIPLNLRGMRAREGVRSASVLNAHACMAPPSTWGCTSTGGVSIAVHLSSWLFLSPQRPAVSLCCRPSITPATDGESMPVLPSREEQRVMPAKRAVEAAMLPYDFLIPIIVLVFHRHDDLRLRWLRRTSILNFHNHATGWCYRDLLDCPGRKSNF